MKQETELKVKVVCLIVVIMLCVSVYINGTKLDCNKCEITFKQSRKLGFPSDIKIEVNAYSLYNNWSNGYCLIEWDNKNGFLNKNTWTYNGN